ncbi:MAG: hypothetical protein WC451_04625 [Patescibacteria group bacterium]
MKKVVVHFGSVHTPEGCVPSTGRIAPRLVPAPLAASARGSKHLEQILASTTPETAPWLTAASLMDAAPWKNGVFDAEGGVEGTLEVPDGFVVVEVWHYCYSTGGSDSGCRILGGEDLGTYYRRLAAEYTRLAEEAEAVTAEVVS